jgi:hypothetical protein
MDHKMSLVEILKKWYYGFDDILDAVTEAISWMRMEAKTMGGLQWRMDIDVDYVTMTGQINEGIGIYVDCMLKPSIFKCILMMTYGIESLRVVKVKDGFRELCNLAVDEDVHGYHIRIENGQMVLSRDRHPVRDYVIGSCSDLLKIEDLQAIPASWRVQTGGWAQPIHNVDEVRQLLRKVNVPVQISTWMSTASIADWEGVKELRWYPMVKLTTVSELEEDDTPEAERLHAFTLDYEERLHGRRTQVVLALVGHVHCKRLYGRSPIRLLTVDMLRLVAQTL